MQQEYIETGSDDIFIVRRRGSQHVKQFRRKKKLEKLKTWIQGDLWHLWPQHCGGTNLISLLLDLCCYILRDSLSCWALSEGMGGCPSCFVNITWLHRHFLRKISEADWWVNGISGELNLGNRGRGRKSVTQKELLAKAKKWNLWNTSFLCAGAGTP